MRLLIIVLGLIAGLGSLFGQEFKSVTAELREKSAWTGEGVTLTIKLSSPGPFSGTAAFDLPNVARTAFLKVGNPVVGSEDVGGKSYYTQIHQFSVYSQQSGKVVIPSFLVRFSGKKEITSEAESMDGKTEELSYESKRPPGTEGVGIIVTTKEMKVSQTWDPAEGREVDAGDVLRRTVTRTAGETTAMIFPPADSGAPEGVKVYEDDPVVEDKTERGVISAKRVETLRYQFVRAGTYTIPELTFSWWDPEAEKLMTTVLPGETVTVKMSEAAVVAAEDGGKSAWVFLVLLGIVLAVGWILRKRITARYQEWQSWRHRPELIAAKNLKNACLSSDARAAYLSAMNWQRAVGMPIEETGNKVFIREVGQLSARLFGDSATSEAWNGGELAKAFTDVRRDVVGRKKSGAGRASLPALNSPAIHS